MCAMWDPISDDNLSSLDPSTANQTDQKTSNRKLERQCKMQKKSIKLLLMINAQLISNSLVISGVFI